MSLKGFHHKKSQYTSFLIWTLEKEWIILLKKVWHNLETFYFDSIRAQRF